jgi:hypothetical protein
MGLKADYMALQLTLSVCDVICARLHLLEHVLRPYIPPRGRSNFLLFLRFFQPDVFQSAGYVESKVPATIVEIRLVPLESLSCLLCFRRNRNKRLANMEDIVPERLQRWDT